VLTLREAATSHIPRRPTSRRNTTTHGHGRPTTVPRQKLPIHATSTRTHSETGRRNHIKEKERTLAHPFENTLHYYRRKCAPGPEVGRTATRLWINFLRSPRAAGNPPPHPYTHTHTYTQTRPYIRMYIWATQRSDQTHFTVSRQLESLNQ
jgi:hypothetical protein